MRDRADAGPSPRLRLGRVGARPTHALAEATPELTPRPRFVAMARWYRGSVLDRTRDCLDGRRPPSPAPAPLQRLRPRPARANTVAGGRCGPVRLRSNIYRETSSCDVPGAVRETAETIYSRDIPSCAPYSSACSRGTAPPSSSRTCPTWPAGHAWCASIAREALAAPAPAAAAPLQRRPRARHCAWPRPPPDSVACTRPRHRPCGSSTK